jgi:hypothetical protein
MASIDTARIEGGLRIGDRDQERRDGKQSAPVAKSATGATVAGRSRSAALGRSSLGLLRRRVEEELLVEPVELLDGEQFVGSIHHDAVVTGGMFSDG